MDFRMMPAKRCGYSLGNVRDIQLNEIGFFGAGDILLVAGGRATC